MLTYTFTLPARAVDALTIVGAWAFLFGVLRPLAAACHRRDIERRS